MELARLTVDGSALQANYRALNARSPGCGAVVKANAYGLGASWVVETLRAEGCKDFFVATSAEALALRAAVGAIADTNIYVLSGPLDAHDAAAMAKNAIRPVLNDRRQLVNWRPHRRLPAAIHVDTGMHRLGFTHDALAPDEFDGVNIALLLTHLANAADPDDPMTQRQLAHFARIRERFPGVPTSVANSAATLTGVPCDIARPGIALYGGNPFTSRPNPMHPVAALTGRVVAVRHVGAGDAVGYGGTYRAMRDTVIAVLGLGYADGVPRQLANRAEVASQGQRLPVVGQVSMDLLSVDATAVARDVRVGQWMEVFGVSVSLDEVASWAGTISYEILTGIGPRVQRHYVG